MSGCNLAGTVGLTLTPLRQGACGSGDAVAGDRILVEVETEAGGVRQDQLAVLRPRHLFEQPEQPRHVFDRQPIRHGADEMDMDFGHPMADDRQVCGRGHAGDLEPGRDAAGAHLSIMTMSTECASIIWRNGAIPHRYSPPASGVRKAAATRARPL